MALNETRRLSHDARRSLSALIQCCPTDISTSNTDWSLALLEHARISWAAYRLRCLLHSVNPHSRRSCSVGLIHQVERKYGSHHG